MVTAPTAKTVLIAGFRHQRRQLDVIRRADGTVTVEPDGWDPEAELVACGFVDTPADPVVQLACAVIAADNASMSVTATVEEVVFVLNEVTSRGRPLASSPLAVAAPLVPDPADDARFEFRQRPWFENVCVFWPESSTRRAAAQRSTNLTHLARLADDVDRGVAAAAVMNRDCPPGARHDAIASFDEGTIRSLIAAGTEPLKPPPAPQPNAPKAYPPSFFDVVMDLHSDTPDVLDAAAAAFLSPLHAHRLYRLSSAAAVALAANRWVDGLLDAIGGTEAVTGHDDPVVRSAWLKHLPTVALVRLARSDPDREVRERARNLTVRVEPLSKHGAGCLLPVTVNGTVTHYARADNPDRERPHRRLPPRAAVPDQDALSKLPFGDVLPDRFSVSARWEPTAVCGATWKTVEFSSEPPVCQRCASSTSTGLRPRIVDFSELMAAVNPGQGDVPAV